MTTAPSPAEPVNCEQVVPLPASRGVIRRSRSNDNTPQGVVWGTTQTRFVTTFSESVAVRADGSWFAVPTASDISSRTHTSFTAVNLPSGRPRLSSVRAGRATRWTAPGRLRGRIIVDRPVIYA